MKVFVSSVRRGLEVERDALPGLITAVGHNPIRFENYTAQTTPSREACLAGIADCDVYLLLLGPHYGHRFADTGQSPTHDEWVAAQMAGIPRLVYRKFGVTLEPDQEDFVRTVGEYTSGAFYDDFADTAELLTKVAAKLRELEQQPGPLSFTPLTDAVNVRWRREFAGGPQLTSSTSILELHVLPLGGRVRPSRLMSELAVGIAARLRSTGKVPDDERIEVSRPEGSVQAEIPVPETRWDDVHRPRLLGVRVDPQGQVALWSTLPGDRLGSVLDEPALADHVAGMLRTAGTLGVVDGEYLAIAIGVDPTLMLAEGRVDQLPRSSATMMKMSERPMRVNPDEAMSRSALDVGAAEAARVLAAALVACIRAPG